MLMGWADDLGMRGRPEQAPSIDGHGLSVSKKALLALFKKEGTGEGTVWTKKGRGTNLRSGDVRSGVVPSPHSLCGSC